MRPSRLLLLHEFFSGIRQSMPRKKQRTDLQLSGLNCYVSEGTYNIGFCLFKFVCLFFHFRNAALNSHHSEEI